MMKKQQGFTLIELVAVIVILGALAVVALPRFIDLQDEAEQAAAEGVAGSLSAASALNYAAYLAESGDHTQITNTDLPADGTDASTTTFAGLMQNSGDLSDFTVTDCGSFSPEEDGESIECELQDSDGNAFDGPVTFTAIATSV